ncbi:MAG: response regulator [Proteobacteria bacterium]|nr:response regulator [Pseudomonadota bacterium]
MSGEIQRPRVYIVDGDESARRAYRQLLQSLSYVIDDFANGTSFLSGADLESAGCVVLDSQLGDMSGVELHDRLRAISSPLSVVFVCSSGDVPSAVACMRSGASHYLLKPIREQQLLDIVNRALRKSSLEAEQALVRRAVTAHLARLTPRERQVLMQLVDGVQYERVSSSLGITKRTVEAHRRRIMEKMGARTLPQLLQQLARVGWPPKSTSHSSVAH